MKFNILYCSFSILKATMLFVFCLPISNLNAQNNCGNRPGAAMDDQYVCAGRPAIANAEGISTNGNAVVQYYLHNNNINNPIDSNVNGFFINNGNYPLNTVLEVTAVVGPPGPTNSPILNDVCTSIQAEGTKVVFLEAINIASSYECFGTNAEIDYVVNGGLPAFDGSPYSISGDVVNTVSVNTSNSFVSFGTSGSYTIEAEDNNECRTTETAQYSCQLPEIVDLALTKKLAPGQASSITSGNNVVFQIEVINQGNVTLQNVKIIDYIPQELTLADPNWTMNGSNAEMTIPAILPPLTAISVNITLNSLPTTSTITALNVAEILSAEIPNGSTITNDDDSMFDNNIINDGIPINDATNDPNDEDDHDVEDIIIEPLTSCIGVAGTMPTDTIFVCFGDENEINVTQSNSILDPNRDVAYYVLHDGPSNVINNVTDISTDGTFANPGNINCKVYYVSYVFGPDSGNGTPNLSSECTIVLPGTPVIWLNEITINSTTECTADGSGFTVSYNANGGYAECFNSTYNVGGTVNNAIINPSQSVEDNKFFANNSSYTISIKDSYIKGCTTNNSFEPVICSNVDPCSSATPGTMSTETKFACAGTKVTETEQGSVLGGLVGYYYLHDNSGSILGTIYDRSPNGEFDDPGTDCETLYISYVIGPDNGSGEPNPLQECAFILPGTPVIWASSIKIEPRDSCNTETGLFTFYYNINGGFAECFNSQYSLTGDVIIATAEPGTNYINNMPLANGSTYTITATDDYGCTNTSDNGPVTCQTLDVCNNSAGKMGAEIIYACSGEANTPPVETDNELNINDVAFYVLHEGSSNFLVNEISSNSTGSFNDPGELYNCNTLYISYVFGPNDGNGQPDLNSPCIKILSGTPVMWAAPIKINPTEDCNEETGQYQFSYNLSGGFPSCMDNFVYNVAGNVSNGIAIPDQIFTEPTFFNNGYAYTISVTDDVGCFNSFSSEPIVCEGSSPCSNSETGTLFGIVQFSCAGISVDLNEEGALTITDNFVDDGDIEGYVLHLGDPSDNNNVININTSGVFEDPGNKYCDGLEITYVIGPDDGTGLPNIEDPCTQFSKNTVSVLWYPPITISSSAVCDENTGNLIVSFNVGGGASECDGGVPFKITGDFDTLENLTAGSYTISNQISSSQPYQITATDLFECTSTFTSEIIDCDQDLFCGNVLGIMSFANQLRKCPGDQASAQQQNTTLASGSIGRYFLHTNSGSTLGIPLANNNSGTFDDPGEIYNCDTLYISYVLGPDDGNGEIDLQSDCNFVLPGAPVVWAPPIKIFTNEVCENGAYRINYELLGGFPECFTSAYYNLSGSLNESELPMGDGMSNDSFESGTTYQLTVTDNFNCSTTYERSEAVNCPLEEDCKNKPGEPKTETTYVCFNNDIDGSVSDNLFIDEGYNITYVLHDGLNSVGTEYRYSTTGVFNNDALLPAIPKNTQLYISSVVSILDSEGKPNYNDICTAIMLPGSPVVFLDEILVNTQILCDDRDATIIVSPNGGLPTYIRNISAPFHYIVNGDTIASLNYNAEYELNTSNRNYEITIADDNKCSVTVGGSTGCGNVECPNQLGSQPLEAVVVCSGESINAEEVINSNITDDAYELIYILHDRQNVIGKILDKNTTGIFINNQQYPTNKQLYVSTVIGILNEDGLPDFLEDCTFANFPGTPVTFSPEINFLSRTECNPDIEEIKVLFNILGGSGQYNITGDYENTVTGDTLLFFVLPYTKQNYELTITDDNSCQTSIVETTDCSATCNNIFNNAGNVNTTFAQFLCGDESITVTADNVLINDGYSQFYVLHDGINVLGEVIDINTTGVFTNSANNSRYEYNKQYYISSLITSVYDGNPDVFDPCLDLSQRGTPVIFYEPITITEEEVCNDNTGTYIVKFTINGGLPSFDATEFYTIGGILSSNNVRAGQEVESAPQPTDTYLLTVEDTNGCRNKVDKGGVVCDSECLQLIKQNITNVISPNDDSINDGWSVPQLIDCYPNHRITICNRWGDRVSEIENCTGVCWDGTASKNGEPLPTGAYFYVIELKGINSMEDDIIKGSITLLR